LSDRVQYKIARRRIVYSNEWIGLVEKAVVGTGDEADLYYSVEGVSDIVSILPIDDCGNVILVEQYRAAVEAYTIDIPGGGVEEGEVIEFAACRELHEETGYQTDKLVHLSSFFIDSGQKNSIKHLYVARCSRREAVGETGIEVVLKPLDQLLDEVDRGLHSEPSLILAVCLARQQGMFEELRVERCTRR